MDAGLANLTASIKSLGAIISINLKNDNPRCLANARCRYRLSRNLNPLIGLQMAVEYWGGLER